jgi:hypothetical protein
MRARTGGRPRVLFLFFFFRKCGREVFQSRCAPAGKRMILRFQGSRDIAKIVICVYGI